MTIRLSPQGVFVDSAVVPCSWVLKFGGGDSRFDKQDRQPGDTATSEVTWNWSGFEERDAKLTLAISPAIGRPRGDPARYAHASAIFLASRETTTNQDGETVPMAHTLIGSLPAAMGLDTVFILGTYSEESSDRGDELVVEIALLEFDPEAATVRNQPIPPDPDPEPPEPEDDITLDAETDAYLDDLNADLLELGDPEANL